MKMNGTGMRIGVTVLALGASLLAIPASPGAKGCRDIARRLAGGLWPRSSAPQFRDFPGSPGGTRLRRGEEPHYRAAIRRLPIRSDAGFSHRTRADAGRCSVHHGHEGVANRR
jgi:hypothetical protein